MPTADTDTTTELPTVSAPPRRRWPWALLAGALATAALGYVLVDDGGGTRLTSGASQAPAPSVTTVPPAPTTTGPAPTVTTTTAAPERLSPSSRLSLDGSRESMPAAARTG